MANWQGTARSNYVKIKDMEGLKEALKPFPIRLHTAVAGPNEGKVCLLSEESDDGGWPSYAYSSDDDDGEDEIEFDISAVVCPYMEPGEILVIMETGAEKLRYISGYAAAFNHEGNAVYLFLSDIYAKAADHFGVPLGSITGAEY